MQKVILTFFLLIVFSCKNGEIPGRSEATEGIWLLVDANVSDSHFLINENQVPLGFRFYSTDSAEIYRNNYTVRRERFSRYRLTTDSIHVFQSDSLGWWRQHIAMENDKMRVFLNTDTLEYQHIIFPEPPVQKINFEKIMMGISGER